MTVSQYDGLYDELLGINLVFQGGQFLAKLEKGGAIFAELVWVVFSFSR